MITSCIAKRTSFVSASMALVAALGARSQLAAGYQRSVVPVKTMRGMSGIAPFLPTLMLNM